MTLHELLKLEADDLGVEIAAGSYDDIVELHISATNPTQQERLVVVKVAGDVVCARAIGFRYSFRANLVAYLTKNAPDAAFTAAAALDGPPILRVVALLRLLGHAIDAGKDLKGSIELDMAAAKLLLALWNEQRTSPDNQVAADCYRVLPPGSEEALETLRKRGCVIVDAQGNVQIIDTVVVE